MNPHTPKWTPILGIKVPMDSWIWTLKFSETDCRDQITLDWDVPYIIGKFLECKRLKWACMTHLDTWNTIYGQKKGQFDSRPLKVKNNLDFLTCRWRATYHWKNINKNYNFSWNLISIEGFYTKLWSPKITGIPILRILGLPFGSPMTKCHLDVGFVKRHRVYYKGGGGGFPQVRAMVSLVSQSLPVIRPSTKSALTMH
jgi:hypothetical protein